ncbi:MAG TPA: alpha-L-rhamnosidase N-terminal domain-containing protein, partial [Puia sp.]|nr:alpha-L-rhamnosidase N-terminal domain-containing protein [Puia sp.]
MQSKKTLALFLLCQALTGLVSAQSAVINPRWQHGYWTARWIADPGSTGNEFGVYHLRKSFTLPDKPASFVVHVSADNRYRLYVNGRSVSTGPARSDLANWNFETVDIASFLQKGDNVVAATVWNFATYRPYAQISFQTAFILQGDGAPESVINSNASWKIILDSSYQPLPIDKEKMHTYIVTADGERLDGNHYPWGYEQPGYDDSRWAQASVLWYPAKTRTFGTDGNWMLVPRAIPLPEETPQRFAAIRRGNIPGMDMRDYKAFLSGKSPLQIPAHSHVTLLLDQSVLTNAYPVLRTSGGRNALLRLSYAEAMVNDQGVKGNRDSVAGKKLMGIADEYMSDGGQDRLYSPLFFRTFRYLQLDIETKNEPLILRDFYSLFTG